VSRVPGILVDDNQLAKTPLMKKKFAERTMKTALAQVVACRLREGYAIRDLQLPKSCNQLEVRMTLPWRDGVKIHYNVTTAWPITSDKCVLLIGLRVICCVKRCVERENSIRWRQVS
jgi:hypothetical protein